MKSEGRKNHTETSEILIIFYDNFHKELKKREIMSQLETDAIEGKENPVYLDFHCALELRKC
jgi:hypothetical protein